MNIGLPEIVVILIVVLIVFGPSRLPELSRAIGRGMREFRKAMRDLEDAVEHEVNAPDKPVAAKKDSGTSAAGGQTGASAPDLTSEPPQTPGDPVA